MVPRLSHILVLAVYCVIDSAQTVFYPESCGEELATEEEIESLQARGSCIGGAAFCDFG